MNAVHLHKPDGADTGYLMCQDSAWKDPRWKPVWRYKGIPCGPWNDLERPV